MGQGDKSGILTPALCRAARGMLNWTQIELAEHSHVSRSTIRDFEGDRHDIHRTTAEQLRLALETGGVAFMDAPGYGLGVFLKNRPVTGPIVDL
ncbi:helix-turn-helix transcriptional regulator [Rhizobium oryziradicis]|uniref:Transcriptional regulator n=1 Tax=Rhizobium oryziradicis TaxID=1867956 RepID=A0A1Q8ZND1_9HYPH|nr:helix-turn-helix transcriptional regulator [Rhizobium oryziradicis]OLP43399.1 transcriptional regulator [Rhizobium oryziradicis]